MIEAKSKYTIIIFKHRNSIPVNLVKTFENTLIIISHPKEIILLKINNEETYSSNLSLKSKRALTNVDTSCKETNTLNVLSQDI